MSQKDSLKTLANKLKVADKVNFIEWNDNMIGSFQQIDVLILPSIRHAKDLV